MSRRGQYVVTVAAASVLIAVAIAVLVLIFPGLADLAARMD